jgi:hypothetical protein
MPDSSRTATSPRSDSRLPEERVRLSARALPPAGFAALAAAVLGPVLGDGYLLLLDSPAGPEPLGPDFTPLPSRGLIASSAPFVALLGAVNSVLPEIGNKLLVFLTVFLGGWGMYRFVTSTLALGAPAGVVGAAFFAVNPWLYERLLAGQLWLTLAYGLLPWALPALVDLATDGGAVPALRAALRVGAIAVIDIHVGGIAVVLLVAAALVSATRLARSVARAALAPVTVLALHLYWVLPAALAREAARLGASDLRAFAPVPRSAQILTHVLLLHGFWRDEFPTPLGSLGPEFLIAFAVIAVFVVYGITLSLQSSRWRRAAVALVLTSGLALALGMGTSFPPTAPIARWLFHNFPGYGVYREPQKWIGLVALAYAVFLAVGIHGLHRHVAHRWGRTVAAATGVLAVLPLVATPLMLWGFAGQVTTSSFPHDWHRVAQAVEASEGRLLFLPWNLYQPLPFAGGRVIANPAELFFPVPTLLSPEARTGGTVSADPRLRFVTKLLRRPRHIDLFGHLVAPLGVRYIALARIADFARFGWLDEQSDLRVVLRGDDMTLYENDAWRGDRYGLNDPAPGVLDHAWPKTPTHADQRRAVSRLAPASPAAESGRLPGSSLARLLPGVESVEPPRAPVLGTSLACTDGWRLGDAEPECHLGAVAAFPQPDEAAPLWRPGLTTQLLGYALSLAALAATTIAIKRASLR